MYSSRESTSNDVFKFFYRRMPIIEPAASSASASPNERPASPKSASSSVSHRFLHLRARATIPQEIELKIVVRKLINQSKHQGLLMLFGLFRVALTIMWYYICLPSLCRV